MSSKRQKKAKPTIRPEGLAWLAQHCNDGEWQRVLDLHRVSLDALLCYIKSICAPSIYAQFEEQNLPPEILAERRKAAAEEKDRIEKANRTIFQGKLPQTTDLEKIFDAREGKGWHDAEHTMKKERERLLAEEAAQKDTTLREIPKAEW